VSPKDDSSVIEGGGLAETATEAVAAEPAPPKDHMGAKGPALVLKDALVYLMGQAARNVISFVMLPVYMHLIRSSEYGAYELMNRAGTFAGIFISLAIPRAMMRIYALRDEREWKNTVVSTALIFSACWGLLLAGACIAASGPLSQAVSKKAGYNTLFALIMLSAWFDAGIQTPMSHMRAKGQSVWFAATSISRLIVGVSLNIYLVVVLRLGIAGIVYTTSVVAAAFWLLLAIKTFRETGLKVSREALVPMLRFGIPLAMSGIPLFVLHFGDRFILGRYASVAAVGTYAVGYRFGMLVGVLVNDPFGLAYEPYSYAIEKRPDAKRIYSRVMTYYALAGLLVFVALSVFGRDIIRLGRAPDYYAAQWVIPWVALGYVFYGVSNTARLGLMLSGRTGLTVPLNAAAAVANVALNFVLVPRFGIIGAAMSTTFSFALLAIINYVVSYRVYPIPCEPVRLAQAAGVAVAVVAVAVLFPPKLLAVRLLSAAAASAAFPGLLVLTGFFHKDEMDTLNRFFSRPLSILKSKQVRSPARDGL
jgi:O-antigen/teichoic acid export membrane protein